MNKEEFPSHFDHGKQEGITKQWDNAKAFAHKSQSSGKAPEAKAPGAKALGAKAPFSVLLPPPNVTGKLHMGHALNATLQDVVVRHERMKGSNVLWQPGLDHAGIATQMLVQRQITAEGGDPKTLSPEKLIQRIWRWKDQHGDLILQQLKGLGMSCDWDKVRFTLDQDSNKAVRHAFVSLYNKGWIKKDHRLVNWDPLLETAVSDLEIEMKEQKGTLWYIRYPVVGKKEKWITVATTRPETMLADVAVAVHPDDKRYKHLHGKEVELPIPHSLEKRRIPIICDDYVKMEQGSGALKITPGHDFNDFDIGKRHSLPLYNIFDKNAEISPKTDPLARVGQSVIDARKFLFDNAHIPEEFLGKTREESREIILEGLRKDGVLEKEEPIVHQVPFSQRSGAIIEPRLSTQWFLDVETMAKNASNAVDKGKTNITPVQWKNDHQRWLKNIRPWCLSRQILWGHRIPIWYDSDGNSFCAHTEEDAKKQAIKHAQKQGKDVIHTVIHQEKDVLDTWFSSALWPLTTLGWPEKTQNLKEFYPTSLLVTGFDIVFFWVARMMMLCLELDEAHRVPFTEIYVHALVRDSKGRKMSKSLGNVVDPLDLTQKYGADALRFTLCAMESQGRDVRLSEQRVKGYRNFMTKIWNASRFCHKNKHPIAPEYDLARPPLFEDSPPISRWIIAQTLITLKKAHHALAQRRFNHYAHELYHGFWHTFCDWYLEMVKIQTKKASKSNMQHFQNTTMWVLETFLRALHPVVPFITEELWHNMGFKKHRKILLAQSVWSLEKTLENSQAITHHPETLKAVSMVKKLQDCVHHIRSFRIAIGMPPERKPMLKASTQTWDDLASYDRDCLCSLARLKGIKPLIGKESHSTHSVSEHSVSVRLVMGSLILLFPLEDEEERMLVNKRLKKQRDANLKEKYRWETLLNSKGFIQKAQADLVENYRHRLKEAQAKDKQIMDALKHL